MILGCISIGAIAQDDSKLVLTGSIRTDNLIPQKDESIGIEYVDKFNSNTYLDLNAIYGRFSAGARLELLQQPMPGFENGFAGQGFANLHFSGNFKHFSFTLGDVYDQFDSGFILRTFEERSLGIDNSLRGGRIKIMPHSSTTIKLLGGRQREYFRPFFGKDPDREDFVRKDWVFGGDIELNLAQLFKPLQEAEVVPILGASYVMKYDPVIESEFNDAITNSAKDYVGAFDVRGQVQYKGFNALIEYALKQGDPIMANRRISKPGEVFFVSTSYSSRPFSVLFQARRTDNMNFVSDRFTDKQMARMINYLPPFTQQQTYTLLSIYPYGTRPFGEWAYQLETRYNIARGTALGGKYGTGLRLNASYIRDIDRQLLDPTVETIDQLFPMEPTDGYRSSFFWLG